MLSAQLRSIGNPDEKPASAVVGHIQLKISGDTETGFVVSWKAHFANPECEASTDFGGGAVMIQDSEDMPSPEDVALIRLLPPGSALGCGDSFLEGSNAISESLAELLVEDPDMFVPCSSSREAACLSERSSLGWPRRLPLGERSASGTAEDRRGTRLRNRPAPYLRDPEKESRSCSDVPSSTAPPSSRRRSR